MKADPVRNMNYLVGGDGYRNKTRVNQAPGGHTSLSLAWGDSSAFEHRRGRFEQQPVYNYGLNNSLEANQKFTNSRDQVPEQKRTFDGFYNLQEARKAKLKPLEDPFKRSWNDGQKFMGSNLNGARSPMENAYMKHKLADAPAYDEPRDPYRAFDYQQQQQPHTTTHYQASQYENPNPNFGRTQLRSRSQVSSLQNNYKNIINDFSHTRGPMESPKNGYSPQFRATGDLSDKWSGIRVTNPPGGGSSFKLWG